MAGAQRTEAVHGFRGQNVIEIDVATPHDCRMKIDHGPRYDVLRGRPYKKNGLLTTTNHSGKTTIWAWVTFCYFHSEKKSWCNLFFRLLLQPFLLDPALPVISYKRLGLSHFIPFSLVAEPLDSVVTS